MQSGSPAAPDRAGAGPRAGSVIIPAHNEERGIGRTLRTALGSEEHRSAADVRSGRRPGLEFVVVCNGCTDRTADAARAVGSELGADIRVIELEEPGKQSALRAGDAAVGSFPRIYLDADVEIDAESLQQLVGALRTDGVEAAAPERVIDFGGGSALVRAYYRVWLSLPSVRAGLFGRGVIAFTEEGHRRILAQPALMSDDLGLSEAFTPAERRVVEQAQVIIRAPRRAEDLLKRRIRVVTGNAQADVTGVRTEEARTSPATLIGILREQPTVVPAMVVFVGITLVARMRARRAIRQSDFSTWLRDESSRD
ncbi:glycosyltransferase involved in cell wall biosynthesis [Friedmanniella endophytica]|uniref:Glycosyltransferase involved in cell wall biosynthesis n=1 Tax=Microlunatus kandeliicorticis TaxID=1759536 RepID=A0A7W3IP85_9ACTN|nr:glycosyltransferase [Microlunatus kandeliicorticis]MBA8792701.1 glycosyltransferase involved in cell wall biosynthesis [Microlunatus kandeliicorticis]